MDEVHANKLVDVAEGIISPEPKKEDIGSVVTTARDCPKRQLPPSQPPESLPFSATSANRATLHVWFMDYNGSSTFSTCKHQPIPLMDSPPMIMLLNEEDTPVACHKAIGIPIHWRGNVKDDIDQVAEWARE